MKNQKRMVFFIGVVVFCIIAIQCYWNYIQYKNNREQVTNEVEIALENGIDTYFTELYDKTMMAYAYPAPRDTIKEKDANGIETIKLATLAVTQMRMDTLIKGKPNRDFDISGVSKKTLQMILEMDTINGTFRTDKEIKFLRGKKQIDSISSRRKETVAIMTNIVFEDLNFHEIKEEIDKELNRKNIHFDYSLFQKDPLGNPIDSLGISDSIKYPFVAVSHSSMLPMESSLELHYPDIFWITLKKGFIGILLSSILSGTIIFSLFYLLHIIKKQKQLSEIKNDFISNITHELKTPIATVTSAVEGMQHFNKDNNPEKNQKYLEVSAQQLDKLKILVEKILETSTMESKDLVLEKESVDLIPLIKNTIEKHKLNTQKSIQFESNLNKFMYDTDVFHFENALSNLIENAIKYGGNEINVRFLENANQTLLFVSDNGNGIPKEHQKMIFDKFYRVPNKNKHSVKGYGIGLYYTKNIIEKHNGTIELKSEKHQTIFKITL